MADTIRNPSPWEFPYVPHTTSHSRHSLASWREWKGFGRSIRLTRTG